ncbi:hypothetical protein KKF55_03735 [Patescibacteria group bacterium]|nr:hypothetical protein [Patescibacteria group bacterium]
MPEKPDAPPPTPPPTPELAEAAAVAPATLPPAPVEDAKIKSNKAEEDGKTPAAGLDKADAAAMAVGENLSTLDDLVAERGVGDDAELFESNKKLYTQDREKLRSEMTVEQAKYKKAKQELEGHQKRIVSQNGGKKLSRQELHDKLSSDPEASLAYKRLTDSQGEITKKSDKIRELTIKETKERRALREPPKTSTEAHMRDMQDAMEDMQTAKGLEKLAYLMKAFGSLMNVIRGADYPNLDQSEGAQSKRKIRKDLQEELKNSSKENVEKGIITNKELANGELDTAKNAKIAAEGVLEEAKSNQKAAEETDPKIEANIAKAKNDVQEAQKKAEVEDAKVKVAEKKLSQINAKQTELDKLGKEAEGNAKQLQTAYDKIIKEAGDKLDFLSGVEIGVAKDGVSLEWKMDSKQKEALKKKIDTDDFQGLIDGEVIKDSQQIKKVLQEIIDKANEPEEEGEPDLGKEERIEAVKTREQVRKDLQEEIKGSSKEEVLQRIDKDLQDITGKNQKLKDRGEAVAGKMLLAGKVNISDERLQKAIEDRLGQEVAEIKEETLKIKQAILLTGLEKKEMRDLAEEAESPSSEEES